MQIWYRLGLKAQNLENGLLLGGPYPRRWHTVLNEALWSYRMACHGSTKVSPYQVLYGHDEVLPWETKTCCRRMFSLDQLTVDDYATLMKDKLDDLAEHQLRALISIEENKKRVAKWYDKKVKAKEFADADLVPIGTKSSKFGKWSPIGRSLSDKLLCPWQCLYFRNSRRS